MRGLFSSIFISLSLLSLLSACAQQKNAPINNSPTTPPTIDETRYYGHTVYQHIKIEIDHLKKHGLNQFEHLSSHNNMGLFPAPNQDLLYSCAVIDLRMGPVIVYTPERDNRYSSIQVVDMEGFTIHSEMTGPGAGIYVLVHDSYGGEVPQGTLIRSRSLFPMVLLRTETHSVNKDKMADTIRQKAQIMGVKGALDLPKTDDPQALLDWTLGHTLPYPKTQDFLKNAIAFFTADIAKQTKQELLAELKQAPHLHNNGLDNRTPETLSTFKDRARASVWMPYTLPESHALYQRINRSINGTPLKGDVPFTLSIPYEPGTEFFWTIGRYNSVTDQPLALNDTGNSDIQSYNGSTTRPLIKPEDGLIHITFSRNYPMDGSFWMPVTEDEYYIVVRYFGPKSELAGNTVIDILNKNVELENLKKEHGEDTEDTKDVEPKENI